MPEIYLRALSSDPTGPRWDFGRWTADAVVINLGTNDVNSGRYNETEYVDAYLSLAATISEAYGPEVSAFVCLCV